MQSALLHADNKNTKRTNGVSGSSSYTKLNLNNISTFIYNNGIMDPNPAGNAGFSFPAVSKKTAVRETGFVWGAKVDGQIRVGGSTVISGLQPGRIISTGVADESGAEKQRVYRVRPDYQTAILSGEAKDEGRSENDIRSQYEKDWNEWPADEGAPFIDINHDGVYEPDVDVPGIKNAAQTVWFVANDLNENLATSLYGSPSMGIEMQVTLWTYNNDWALKNVYFKKYRLINKSNSAFKEMYVSLWADPDNGDALDDFAGCDTTLNLGFCYNASIPDAVYGNTPPATGYDLVQGPLVNGTQSDTAIFGGRKVAGKKNLPISSSYFFVNSVFYEPSLGTDYNNGTLHFYNLLQGKISSTPDGYFSVPASLGGGKTKFPLSGDPVAQTGYLDGMLYSKGDRRVGISSGPFEINPGEEQEVVFAEIAAQGSSNIQSVSLLKTIDKEIQKKYDSFFNLQTTPAPPAPSVKAVYTKNDITLFWNNDVRVEGFEEGGYDFEGYNIYQLNPDYPEKRFAKRLATFDIKNGITSIYGEDTDTLTGNPVNTLKQRGTDSGIKRSFTVSFDSLAHSPFIIGKKYLFAINAYSYRKDPAGRFTTSESPLSYVTVIFQDSLPGFKYMDTLSTSKASGVSRGRVIPVVIDPSCITGHNYKIGLTNVSDSLSWFLEDVTLNKMLLQGQPVNNANNPYPDGPVIDGVKILVISAPVGMSGWIETSGSLKWSWTNANVSGYPVEGFHGAIGDGYEDWPLISQGGSSVKACRIPNTLIKFASTDTLGNILNPDDPGASFAYRYLRNAQSPAVKPEFAPFIKNNKQSYDYQDYTKTLPFAAYNYDTGERYMVGYLENNTANGKVDGKYWPPKSTDLSTNNSATTGPREWFFIFDIPYSEKPDTSLQVNIYNQPTPVLWFGMPARAGNAAFSSDDEFLMLKNDLFTAEDVFTFNTGQMTSLNSNGLPTDYELKQNYPNPFNPSTTIRFSLKDKGFTILRVYNILGQEVRELVNGYMDAGIHSINFDASGLASGVYIYRLDVKDKYTEVKKMLMMK